MELLGIVIAIVVAAIEAFVILRFRVLGDTDIATLMKYVVVITAISTAVAAYIIGLDPYEYAAYGIVGGLVVAMWLKLEHDQRLKKKQKGKKEEGRQEPPKENGRNTQ